MLTAEGLSPVPAHNAAMRCFRELSRYIEELRGAAKHRLETEDVGENLNVLGEGAAA